MIALRRLAASTLLLASACAPRAAPEPPRPAPQPRAVPAPVPAPPPRRISADWLQAPIGPGDWSYRAGPTGSVALWGAAGEGARLALACDRASRTVRVTRAGATAGTMEIRTTNGSRSLTATADRELPGATASLPAADEFLNRLVFSRGRFLVAATGAEPLIVPTWAEPFRVVEDCRA